MESEQAPRTRGMQVRTFAAAVLMLYGALGVAVHLRLFALLFGGLVSWLGGSAASDPVGTIDPLAFLRPHYDAMPWLPWAAWLAGTALLYRPSRAREQSGSVDTADDAPRRFRVPLRYLVIGSVLLLLLVGGYTRMAELWPQSRGISQFPYDDEGVYAGVAQLAVQGILPYRDYFFAHPPVAALAYAPAMVYHFTQWGSPTSFMDARYLSVAYSLVTLVLIFLSAYLLVGPWGAIISAALWALDGRVVEINRKVMLDGPMVLLSCAGLLLYLWVRPLLSGEDTPDRMPRRPMLVLGLAALLATLSALTKIAGVACLIAILFDLAWIHLENRRRRTTLAPMRDQLGSVALGIFAAVVVVLGPFLIIAPSQFIREVIFFQLLRPSDGLIDVPARIADLTATYGNALTPLLAALGFLSITAAILLYNLDQPSRFTLHVSRSLSPWRVVVLWTFFSVLLFTYSRSFYSHYYIQLAAPLCLLGAGAALLPALVKVFVPRTTGDAQARPWALLATAAVLLIVALPLIAVQWGGLTSRHEDRIFEIVGRYITDAVPPGTPVLTTDEQFNILAARPPSHSATGYLVDSYGHMIFHGLGMDTQSWGDLISAALRGKHSNDAYAVMHLPAAQADIVERARTAPLIVLHQKGMPRLTQETLQTIAAESKIAEQQPRYTIYRVTTPGASSSP